MREPIGGTDDESIEGVAAVETGSAGNGWLSGMWTFGEVVGPTPLGTTGGFTIFVTLVGIDGRLVGEGIHLRDGDVIDVFGGRSDAHSQLDLLPEPAAQRVGDRRAQMTFDLILDEAAR